MTQPGDDVLFSGPDRPPRRTSPLLLVACAVVAGALLMWQLVGGRSAPVDTVPSPLPATAAPLPVVPSSPEPSASVATHELRPADEKTGARLVLSGRSLVDIVLDSGEVRTTSVPGRIVQSLRVQNGDVLLVEGVDRARTALFSANERDGEVQLGPAQSIVAAVDDEHVWLEVPSPAGTPNVLRKVALDGQVVSTTDLGPWRAGIHETARGMVTTSNAYFSQSLELWDIEQQRVTTQYWLAANLLVVDADARHVAFVLPNCQLELCPMKLVDVQRGAVVDLPMPAHWETYAAAFSTNGATLAVLGHPTGRGRAWQPALLIVDLAMRRATSVGGVDGLTSRSALLSWSPDSRWLFAAAGPETAPLLSYRVGDGNVRYEPLPEQAQALQPRDFTALSAY